MAVGTSPGELRELNDEELIEKLREFKEELEGLLESHRGSLGKR